MSIAILPPAAPAFISPATGMSVPVNGDALDATFMKTSVEQPVLDATEAARMNLIGGGVRRRVLGTSATSLTIKGLGAVTVETAAGVWTTVAVPTSVTIDPTAVFGAALVADTRYWVYATITAGALAWHVSTTAPDAGFRFKTGDTSKMYVSTFITGAAGALIAYKQSENFYEYLTFPLGAVHGNKVVDAGSALVITPITLSTLAVPAGYTTARLFAQVSGTGAGAYAIFYPDTGAGMYCCKVYSSARAVNDDWVVQFEAGGSAATDDFAYIVDAGTTAVEIWVQSFVL
jgi:hypothetical protein